MRASIVIALLNEAGNVRRVCQELAALEPTGDYEIIFVDDGSTDGTADLLRDVTREQSHVRLLRHDRRCGKSAALRTGILAAQGEWIATMDGDGQNDAHDVVRLLHAGWACPQPVLVAGVRLSRADTMAKRISSRFANRLRQAMLGDDCPDTGCGLKAFPRDAFLRLPAFEGMHRFLPALFQFHGLPLICVTVADRPRLAGTSKYTNWGRALVGLGDLLGVLWLRRRTHLPATVVEE